MTSNTSIYFMDALRYFHFQLSHSWLTYKGGNGSQKLFILVRDWQFPYEKQFGVEGGAELLRYGVLLNKKKQVSEY